MADLIALGNNERACIDVGLIHQTDASLNEQSQACVLFPCDVKH